MSLSLPFGNPSYGQKRAREPFVCEASFKHSIFSADLLNNRVIPFFDLHQAPLLRIFTERGI
jgi:hypothetical protein